LISLLVCLASVVKDGEDLEAIGTLGLKAVAGFWGGGGGVPVVFVCKKCPLLGQLNCVCMRSY
jgi:hypothetical protein